MFRLAITFLFLILVVPGCGSGKVQVSGRVQYDDGSPVTEGTVIGEAQVNGKTVGVQGGIGKDGAFSLGTDQAGDGAFPGNYKILLMPPGLGDAEMAAGKKSPFDSKYSSYDSSGILFEVKQGKNELQIKVAKPGGKNG